MGFDLSKVLQNANEVKNNENENSAGNGLKLVYTIDGDIKVKLLFNPSSGLVTRKIDRHSIGGNKVPCMTMYGQPCPVCKQIETIQNAKGLDLWKLKKTTRGIAFAQYIESNYKWEKPEYEPKPGEVILLMFPWTVYKDINKIIAEAGAQAETVVATNTGRVVKISRWKDGNQVKYAASIDAWAQPYTSCEATDGKTADQVFEDMLNNMESLNNKICPMTLDDETVTKCKELSDSLYREYLQGNVEMTPPTQQAPAGNFGANNFQQQQQPTFTNPASNFQPQQPNFTPQQPQNNVQYPECFGCIGNCDPNKRLICPYEMLCSSQTK